MAKFPRCTNTYNHSHYSSVVVGEDMVLTREQSIKNGIVCHEAVWKKENPEDLQKGLKWTDFCISNLIAVGATDQLKEVGTLSQSSFTAVDSIPDVPVTETNSNESKSE